MAIVSVNVDSELWGFFLDGSMPEPELIHEQYEMWSGLVKDRFDGSSGVVIQERLFAHTSGVRDKYKRCVELAFGEACNRPTRARHPNPTSDLYFLEPPYDRVQPAALSKEISPSPSMAYMPLLIQSNDRRHGAEIIRYLLRNTNYRMKHARDYGDFRGVRDEMRTVLFRALLPYVHPANGVCHYLNNIGILAEHSLG